MIIVYSKIIYRSVAFVFFICMSSCGGIGLVTEETRTKGKYSVSVIKSRGVSLINLPYRQQALVGHSDSIAIYDYFIPPSKTIGWVKANRIKPIFISTKVIGAEFAYNPVYAGFNMGYMYRAVFIKSITKNSDFLMRFKIKNLDLHIKK